MRLVITGEYPADWKAIAVAVKDAARWCCIRCGHAHDIITRRCLTVHHMDGDKANCRWWNLLPLCQVCHLTIQGKVIPERPYLWEHSDWIKPYVAGFYAWYYGETEITREEAMLDLDHWLALGQPWRTA